MGAVGVGPLTWGNICCVEMETDDSNYVQSQGLQGEDGGRNGGEFEATASIRTPGPSPTHTLPPLPITPVLESCRAPAATFFPPPNPIQLIEHAMVFVVGRLR